MSGKNIVVNRVNTIPLGKQYVEIVERKGIGHPDYIADAIAEAVSVALSKEYLKRYDKILHHNLDKVLVVGGQSNPRFGGGEVIQPIYILVSGRATIDVKRGENDIDIIPVGSIILDSAKKWLKNTFRFLDTERHVIIDYKVGKGSADLIDIFEREEKYPGANDTSVGVGFAPLTKTEKMVLETERLLNSKKFKKRHPAVGEDIKVMGVRRGNHIDLTIAAAIVSSQVSNVYEYLKVKEEIIREVKELAVSIVEDMEVKVYVNTGDNPSRGERGGLYLVVTGTSAEHGDDGATGRGNRANGLITPFRPMSMEATAGKNPISHVGKLYNVLAYNTAQRITELGNVEEVYVKVLSQIGKPINEPLIAHITINSEESVFNSIKKKVEEIVEEELNNLNKLWRDIIDGRVNLF